MAVPSETSRYALPAWTHAPSTSRTAPPASDGLFERAAPVYAFMREHLFRDDTDRIAASLWPTENPATGTLLLEIGCGPGLYTRRLASRYPGVRAVGIDRSPALVARAATRAASDRLSNCWFQQGDALALDWPEASVDAVVASRLFTVVNAARALGEIHRVLRPGGRCFLAEPISALGTLVPFVVLRLASWLASAPPDEYDGGALDSRPRRVSEAELAAALDPWSWGDRTISSANGYLYAVCQKPPVEAA